MRINFVLTFTLLLLTGLRLEAKYSPEPDSTAVKDSVGDKHYLSAEDSLAFIDFDLALEAKKHEMKELAKDYQSVHIKVDVEFSGVFYPEPDYAVYNLRWKKSPDFNMQTDKFSLRLYQLSDNNEKVFIKAYDYDTIDCGNFTIKLPRLPNVKAKYALDYVDIFGKSGLLETITLDYQQNAMLNISQNLFDKSVVYATDKSESFQSFILKESDESDDLERLIYTQNQFNVFPSELLVGNSKTLPPWCGTQESVNPCDTTFLKKWISSYTVSLKDIRNLDYYVVEKCLLSNRRFSDLLNTYVKNLLPAWKSWKDSCYKTELKPRGDEMPCDCQRISSNFRTMYNGKYFEPQFHPHSPIQIRTNSSANGKEIREFWDGTDGKSLFQGNIFGPTFWAVHESWGSCTPDFYGPEYNAANRMVNPPNPPYKTEDAPLSQSFIMMYTCSNKSPFDENYWPEDCACPLDVQGKIYSEATLMTSADFRSNCFWDTYARADVETAGLGLVRVYKPSRPIVAGTLRKSGDVLYWNTGLAAAQSSFKSRFNWGAPFEALFYLGANILESALVDWVAVPGTTGGASPLQIGWQNIAPLKKTFASGPIKKNEVLVDLNWRHQLGANFPIEAVLYNFYKISAKGQDGWFSKAALETRGLNTYFIEANEPSSGQSQYCCNDFIAQWFHSGEGGVWNIDMKNKVESFVNLNNTVPWITVNTNNNYNSHSLSMDCNLFRSYVYKGAGTKRNPHYAFRSENHLRWTHSSSAEMKIEVIDLMGKLLYSNKLIPQKDNVIINLNNFGRSLIFISISGPHGDQLFKVMNN